VRTHASHLARPRTRSFGIVALLVGALLVAFAAPASAHTVVVSGTTSCPDENHLVTWTISNPETLADRSMIIVSATAEVDGVPYPVEGYDAGVPPQGSTQATSVVPGDVTGTIDITVRVRFPDNFRAHAEASVELTPPCEETTTTTSPTTAPPTTASTSPPVTGGTSPTTAGPSPSTGGPGPSGGPQGSAGPDQTGGVAGIEAGAGGGSLPTTGAASTNWALVGVVALLFGTALVAASRRTLFSRR
jgi:LPXTG-motif cell wall-anchored protein